MPSRADRIKTDQFFKKELDAEELHASAADLTRTKTQDKDKGKGMKFGVHACMRVEGRKAISGIPSTMKTSVEVQQLDIQFNEILGITPEDSDVRVNTRPYVKYFQRAVRKVTSSLTRLIEQKAIQKSVFSWIDANLEVLQAKKHIQKEKASDDVLRDVNRDMKYWDRVHVEAGHDVKSGRSIFQTSAKDRRLSHVVQKTSLWGGKGRSQNSLSAMLYNRICSLKSDTLRDDLLPLAGAEYDGGTHEERRKLEQVVTKNESSRYRFMTQKTGSKNKKNLAAILRDCFKQNNQVTFMTMPSDAEFESGTGNSASFSQHNNSVYSQITPQNSTYGNQYSQYSVDESYPSLALEDEVSSRGGKKLVTRFRDPRNAGASPVKNVIPLHCKTRQAEKRYVQNCHDHGVLPGRHGFHCAMAKNVNLAGHDLDDKSIKALAGAIGVRNQDIETIDLSQNRASDKSMGVLLQALECPFPRTLNLLDISRNRLGLGSFDVLSVMLRNRQLDVRCLKLSGIAIPISAFKPLCGAIIANSSVREVDLSDSQCGRHCQDPCTQVAQLCYAVDSLNISQNFFREEGLRELSQKLSECKHLKTLVFADNTWVLQQHGGNGASPSKYQKKAMAALGFEGKVQDPMWHFCESLQSNTTLTTLDLSGCQIAQEAAICLEDSLLDHSALKQLDLSRNPLGESGLRAILRIVMKTSNLQLITVNTIRESATKPAVSWSYTNLNDEFSHPKALDLSEPYHRAIMRLVLRRIQDFGVSIADALQDFKVDGKSERPHFECKNGRWHLPSTGVLEFMYSLDPIGDSISCPADAVRAWQGCRRLRVRFSRFVVLMHMWRQLTMDSERRIFLLAAAKDLLFKLGQVTFLAQQVAKSSSSLVAEMLCGFTTTFENADRATINIALRCVRGKTPTKNIFEDYMTRNGAVLKFNPSNCTGRYTLRLENAGDYSVAEQLLVVNQWEALLARSQGLLDTGEAGAHYGIRNFSYAGVDSVYDPGFVLPGDGFVGQGFLKCDYVTPLARPKRSATMKKMPNAQFASFLSLLKGEGTDASEQALHQTLHSVSHRIYLSAYQLHQILSFMSKDYVLQTYVYLFPRCLEFGPPMIGRDCGILGDHTLFDLGAVKELEERLGMPNTLDCLSIHQQPWNNFCWDLAKRDQHMCANVAIILAGIEPGENIKNPNWSAAHVMRGVIGGAWCVPTAWSESLPKKGLFSMTYICEQESPEYVVIDKRKELGRKYFGWVSLADPGLLSRDSATGHIENALSLS